MPSAPETHTVRLVGTALMLLALTSCFLRSGPSTPDKRVGMRLLPPSSYDLSVVGQHQMTGLYGDQKLSLQLTVSITPERLEVVGISQQGQPLFTLKHDGKKLAATSSRTLPSGFNPTDILLDFQMAFAPVGALLGAVIPGHALEFGERSRRLLRNGKAVSRVEFDTQPPWKGTVFVHNTKKGYALNIRTVQWQQQ